MGKKQLEPGRRELVKDEVLFIAPARARKRCQRRHTWIEFGVGRGESVVGCGVCGRAKRGQTAPAWLEPKTA
jgi:hypothetical protein